MRILVISRSAWRNDNNTGNTLSDLFSGIDAEIFSLCFRDELPDNKIAKSNFAISEGQLIKSLKSRKYVAGKENSNTLKQPNALNNDNVNSEERIYTFAKNSGVFSIFLKFAREILWSFGGYKTDTLKAYIEKVNPDIIFMPLFNCFYPNKVLSYIHTLTSAKIVLFHADDNFSLKTFSLNPFYWIYRFLLRKNIRKSVAISNKNYVISALQKSEYEKSFKRECKILTKSADFSNCISFEKVNKNPLELVYTGNLSVGRWKTLSLVTKALQEINQTETKAVMRIYSLSKLKDNQLSEMADGKNTIFCGGISAEEVSKIQNEADILVYPESFSIKDRLEVRQSFSTKIVDYLGSGNPIFAVGPAEIASINYFLDNNSAVVSTNKSTIKKDLIDLIENSSLRVEYAKQAYDCGMRNHNSTILKNDFYNDLQSIL